MKQHKTPCNQCPWRRASAPGWLGDSTPGDFWWTAEQDTRMPCHNHIDYERKDWKKQIEKVPQCAGRAIAFANRCKLPRDKALLRLPADKEKVFSTPQEFLDHHNRLIQQRTKG